MKLYQGTSLPILDIRQLISSAVAELYSLHLHFSNFVQDILKRIKLTINLLIMEGKFSSLRNSNPYAVSTLLFRLLRILWLISLHPLTDVQRDGFSVKQNFHHVSKPDILNLIAPIRHSLKNIKISSGPLYSPRFFLAKLKSTNNNCRQKI